MQNCYIKNRAIKAGDFQFFMHQFIAAAIKYGIVPIGSRKQYGIILRTVRKCSIICYKLMGRCTKFSKKKIIITSQGRSLIYDAWPFCHCEVIPMLWDCWPDSFDTLLEYLKIMRVKDVFFTQSQVAEKVKERLGINTYWIPEGIDTTTFDKGDDLSKRGIVLYELGRQHPKYHQVIETLIDEGTLASYRSNTYDSQGRLLSLAFPTAEILHDSLPNIQIVVSFPRSMTHPELSGDIETLTQRYWESMLSRSLIVGHCPQELQCLLKYNPVVEVDWDNPESQLRYILSNISDYQELVDRNYYVALANAPWKSRLEMIDSALNNV